MAAAAVAARVLCETERGVFVYMRPVHIVFAS